MSFELTDSCWSRVLLRYETLLQLTDLLAVADQLGDAKSFSPIFQMPQIRHRITMATNLEELTRGLHEGMLAVHDFATKAHLLFANWVRKRPARLPSALLWVWLWPDCSLLCFRLKVGLLCTITTRARQLFTLILPTEPDCSTSGLPTMDPTALCSDFDHRGSTSRSTFRSDFAK